MIPIENSLAGRVADIHHLLPTSDLSIVGEYFLPVHHQLLGVPRRDARGPGGRAEPRPCARPVPQDHPRARPLRRGRRRHRRLGPLRRGARRPDARARSRSRLAAEIYGLDILRENVEDEAHNTTRFVILSREAARAPAGQRPGHHLLHLPRPQRAGRALQGARRLRHQRRQHDQAGELPARRKFFATLFYADVEGHPDDHNLKLALEELEFFSAEFRIVGVYPASPFRANIAEPAANRDNRPPDKPRTSVVVEADQLDVLGRAIGRWRWTAAGRPRATARGHSRREA